MSNKMEKTTKIVSLLLFFALASAVQAVQLTHLGVPVSEIIIASDAPETEKYAANELQYWLCSITGALIPMLNEATETPNVKLYVGRSFATDYEKDIAEIGSTDGYAVRNTNKGKNIFIFGSVPRGTLNGIYMFLEKNSDIIWHRPDWSLGNVSSLIHSLDAKKIDFLEKPKSTLRGWGWTMSHTRDEEKWASRNRINWLGYYSTEKLRMGNMYSPAGGGHGLRIYMSPEKYFDSHPEYFPMMKGKRVKHGQLCFLAYEMVPEYVKNLREDLDKKKGSDGVNISITDGWGVCDCPKCLEPFKLDDGTVIQPSDKLFRSVQFYVFLNKIAKEIKESHPDTVILTYAYIFTVMPPPLKLESNIRVMYCPFVKNDKFPIFDKKRNELWREYLIGWSKATDKTWLREYYGCASHFPRPLEDVVQKDLQFCLDNNVFEFSSELPVDRPHGKADSQERPDHVWDVSAMTMWVITRLWWDPDQDVDELRNYYLERTYREAAPAMKEYYELIRKSWYASPMPSIYSDDQFSMAKSYILEAGIADACIATLNKAAETAVHPVSKELVRRQIARFEIWMEKAKNDKTVRLNVPYNKEKLSKNFDPKAWEKAAETGEFIVCNVPEDKQKTALGTSAKIAHDRANLYIMLKADANDMETLKGTLPKEDGSETFPRGDHFEIFIGDKISGEYYQFAYDVDVKALYDAKGYNSAWTSSWGVETKRMDNHWLSIVTIPLQDIGCNITENNKLLFMPYRSKYYKDGEIDPKTKQEKVKREHSSWGGGFVHQLSAFGEITLEQN